MTHRTSGARFQLSLVDGFWRVRNVDLGLTLPAAYLPQDKMRAIRWALRNGVIVD